MVSEIALPTAHFVSHARGGTRTGPGPLNCSIHFELWFKFQIRDLVLPFDFYIRWFFGSMYVSVTRSTYQTIII